MTTYVSYSTGLDGWGEIPTSSDVESWTALVKARLAARFPEAQVSVRVDGSVLCSRVETDLPDVDLREIADWIGCDVWDEWCGGVRANGAEVQS